MLLTRDLTNEDRRLNLLVTQYEELNQQLIHNLEVEERARVQLDRKKEAQRVLLRNSQNIDTSSLGVSQLPKKSATEFLGNTTHVCRADFGYCQHCQRDPHSNELTYKYSNLDLHLRNSSNTQNPEYLVSQNETTFRENCSCGQYHINGLCLTN